MTYIHVYSIYTCIYVIKFYIQNEFLQRLVIHLCGIVEKFLDIHRIFQHRVQIEWGSFHHNL